MRECVSFCDCATVRSVGLQVCFAGGAADLPVSCEYMDSDSITAIDQAGRVLCYMIGLVGIGPRLKSLWDAKIRLESFPIPYVQASALQKRIDILAALQMTRSGRVTSAAVQVRRRARGQGALLPQLALPQAAAAGR